MSAAPQGVQLIGGRRRRAEDVPRGPHPRQVAALPLTRRSGDGARQRVAGTGQLSAMGRQRRRRGHGRHLLPHVSTVGQAAPLLPSPIHTRARAHTHTHTYTHLHTRTCTHTETHTLCLLARAPPFIFLSGVCRRQAVAPAHAACCLPPPGGVLTLLCYCHCSVSRMALCLWGTLLGFGFSTLYLRCLPPSLSPIPIYLLPLPPPPPAPVAGSAAHDGACCHTRTVCLLVDNVIGLCSPPLTAHPRAHTHAPTKPDPTGGC